MTSTGHDAAGRVVSVTEPDGRCVHTAYDGLPRAEREWHTVGSGTVKDTWTAYDWMSRPVETLEMVGALQRNATYGADHKLASTTSRYAGLTSDVTMSGQNGLETQREATGDATSIAREVTRDDQDRVTQVSLDTAAPAAGISYDAAGKMVSQTGLGFGASGAAYGYGDSGLKTSESVNLAYDGSSLAASYGYTSDGRLSGAAIDGGLTRFRPTLTRRPMTDDEVLYSVAGWGSERVNMGNGSESWSATRPSTIATGRTTGA